MPRIDLTRLFAASALVLGAAWAAAGCAKAYHRYDDHGITTTYCPPTKPPFRIHEDTGCPLPLAPEARGVPAALPASDTSRSSE